VVRKGNEGLLQKLRHGYHSKSTRVGQKNCGRKIGHQRDVRSGRGHCEKKRKGEGQPTAGHERRGENVQFTLKVPKQGAKNLTKIEKD